MLTTAEARQAILTTMRDFGATPVALDECAGRILRQEVVAERDQPPFDRVMMDGIALSFDDVETGEKAFPVQAMQAAGDATLTLDPGHCIEIMTGASLPEGADCIVPVERIVTEDGLATLEPGYAPTRQQFIHPRASDHAAGTVLLEPGRKVMPADVAVIAAAGLSQVSVSTIPVIRIISTGNELVAPGEPIAPHQILASNGPAMAAMLRGYGYTSCAQDHLPDDRAVLAERIARHLTEADVLILSGGVSMGKADFVPGVLAELGVEVVFHRISQRPGKPMWFGSGPRGQVVFALPGNPVSALVCCRQYVVPALESASGLAARLPEFASLSSDIDFAPDLTCFHPVRLVSNAVGQVLAMPVATNTSGDFTSLSASDGYVELAREQSHFAAGSAVLLHRWLIP
jgi:molybdopterin molybdotransferase